MTSHVWPLGDPSSLCDSTKLNFRPFPQNSARFEKKDNNFLESFNVFRVWIGLIFSTEIVCNTGFHQLSSNTMPSYCTHPCFANYFNHMAAQLPKKNFDFGKKHIQTIFFKKTNKLFWLKQYVFNTRLWREIIRFFLRKYKNAVESSWSFGEIYET